MLYQTYSGMKLLKLYMVIMITNLFVPCLSCINLLELEDTLSNYISHKKIVQVIKIANQYAYFSLTLLTEL